MANESANTWVAQNPERHRANGRRWYAENREAVIARQKKRYQENREAIREYQKNYRLMKAHGITMADFKAMEAAQNGVCAICGGQEPVHPRLNVDHCHETGMVRALLCTPCNTALGLAGDDPDRLRAMAEYVEAHRGE